MAETNRDALPFKVSYACIGVFDVLKGPPHVFKLGGK